MKRISILFVIAVLIGISSIVSAEIFMKGPVWYNETCNPYAFGDIKQISVSGNYVAAATECNCDLNKAESCNGVFIFNVDVNDIENIPKPFIYSTNGWIESINVDKNQVVAGSSDNYLYYFGLNEYNAWAKKWEKNLGETVTSVYVLGNYIAAGSGNYVYIFDTNGNEKWKYNVNSKINVLTIIDDRVVAGTSDSHVYIFGISGNIIKDIKTGGAIESIYSADGLIAVGSDKIYLFDTNGNEKWKSETQGTIKSVHFADGTLVAGSLDNMVYIFDMAGKPKAIFITNSSVWSVHVSGDYVAAGATQGMIYLIDTAGEVKWKYPIGAVGSIRSSGVNSVYNTETYVYTGGWGKNVYLFNSGALIAEEEIKKANTTLNLVKGKMDTKEAEAVLQKATDELNSYNYSGAMKLAKEVKPMIVNDIENMIAKAENDLNKLSNTTVQKYAGLSDTLTASRAELENARKLLLGGKESDYVNCIKTVSRPKGKIEAEIGKIIENATKTIEKASNWDETRLMSILAQESEYSAMSKEETEAELGTVGEIDITFPESERKIDAANASLRAGEYETAIKNAEEAVSLVELKISGIINETENEIKKTGEERIAYNAVPMMFKVSTVYSEKDLGVAKRRLNHTNCGAKYEEDCPDYSAAIFWSKHALGIASKDKTIAVAKNLVVYVILIFIIFIAVQWYRGKKKEEKEEIAEKEGEGMKETKEEYK